jgi:hypothetical protein
MSKKPLARKTGLVVETVDDGLFVIDEKRATAHYLKGPTAFVWQRCDGQRSIEELVELVRRELGVPAAPEVVRLALDMLGKARLLEERAGGGAALTRWSRRDLLRAAGLVPPALMISLSLPRAARAASEGVTEGGGE